MFYPLQIYSILDKVKKSSRIICWNGLNEAGLGCRCANVRHDNECLRLPRIIRCRNTTFGMSLYGYAYIWISPLGRVWCRMRSTFPWKSEREKKNIYILYVSSSKDAPTLETEVHDNPVVSFQRKKKRKMRKGKTWRGMTLECHPYNQNRIKRISNAVDYRLISKQHSFHNWITINGKKSSNFWTHNDSWNRLHVFLFLRNCSSI